MKRRDPWSSFDLTKAFDRLDHSKVLHLCHQAGIGGYLGVCLQNWLTFRSQYVEMDINKSPETVVGKSCVQGSVLGPTLWIIYVNSLLVRLEADGVQADVFAYADDLSILKHIETTQEMLEFYHILEIIQAWAMEYDMIWSAAKTQRLVFKHRGCREPRPPRLIWFNGVQIMPMETKSLKTKCVSLGIIISKSMMFKEQLTKVENQLKSLKTIMSRFFHNKTEELMVKFYWTYMVPIQIYCCQVWQPMSEAQLKPLNNAIASYWKMNKARGRNGGPPDDFLEPSLHFILLDLIFVHKIYKGMSKLDFNQLFKICVSNTRQATEQLLMRPKWRLQFTKHKLSFRAVTSFNFLPPGTRELSPALFKKAARTHILENREDYLNMTRNHNIIGHKKNQAPNPEPNNKLKEKKRLNIDKFYLNHNGFATGKNTINRGAKAWFPYCNPKPPTGTNPSPMDGNNVVNTELFQGELQGKKVPLCLRRLQ